VGSSEARYGLITDHKARILTDLFFHADGNDGIIIDAEPGTREMLGARLERYIIADDVELTDVSEDWQLWHCFGNASKIARLDGISARRVGEDGQDVWLRKSEPIAFWSPLTLSEA
jgi:folate-binding Fe-S cluster repair protein YgfZ